MNRSVRFTDAGGAAPPPAAPSQSPHDPPPGARLMNGVRWALIVGLTVLAIVSIAGYVMSRRAGTEAASAGPARYYCPMHPTYTSARPGECPICNMTLEPIPEQGVGGGGDDGDVEGLTAVRLSPDRIQMIGVRTARVTREAFAGEIDLVGFVTPDESSLRRVQLRVAGWVQSLAVDRTGARVTRGQPLLDLYSPELYQSEREYLIETGSTDTSGHEAAGPSSALERLRLMGVPDEEIERLARTRTASTRLTLRSPVTGTVLERGVSQGQYVSADTPLLTVADLSRVWVLADLYEMDLARVSTGDRATFTTDGLPGRRFEGRVDFVYPTVSSETRTLKVRIALASHGGDLRPGMFGNVRLAPRGRTTLTVPAEAVVHTGEQRYVFLARADGHFVPREVVVGQAGSDRVEILRGVAAGDTVVASASFLIDSESRLKAALAGMGAQPHSDSGAAGASGHAGH